MKNFRLILSPLIFLYLKASLQLVDVERNNLNAFIGDFGLNAEQIDLMRSNLKSYFPEYTQEVLDMYARILLGTLSASPKYSEIATVSVYMNT